MHDLHQVVLSNISDTVLITDDAGAFTYVCPNVAVIFGYSPREVYAMGNVTNLLGNGLFDRDELEHTQEIKNIEHTITDKAGRERWLLVNVKRVSIREGTTLYTCRDITHRKRVSQARRGGTARIGSPLPDAVQPGTGWHLHQRPRRPLYQNGFRIGRRDIPS